MACYICGNTSYTSGGICWICAASDILASNFDRLSMAAVGI